MWDEKEGGRHEREVLEMKGEVTMDEEDEQLEKEGLKEGEVEEEEKKFRG